MKKYQLSSEIKMDQDFYEKWLKNKAQSMRRRNRRGHNTDDTSLEQYRNAIHHAVCVSKGLDFFTGDKLDWSLLRRWNNNDAKKFGLDYIKKFANLPTIDHYGGRKKNNFVVCSWIVNDSKSHLSHADYVKLCKKVVSHSKRMMNIT